MFENPPQFYAHKSALNNGNFVTEDEIIFKDDKTYTLKSRECPHRGYIMHTPGEVIKNVVCKMHGFAWDQTGKPLQEKSSCEHFYKLPHHGEIELGKSGLLFKNFKEPVDAEWVNLLSKETDLEFNRTICGNSTGSWLWFMEQLADVLHIRQNGIHPRQSLETPLDTIELGLGDSYVTQIYTLPDGTKGHWIYIFPGFAIEFEPGKLLINRVIPHDKNNEFGFNWELQLYYSPWIDAVAKEAWEKQIEVFMEDIGAVEKIKRPFFPLKRKVNDLENLTHYWGQWYLENLKKD
jgi:nitrite reductase/ring-hydroxylating ferredoxin subunit